MSTVLRALLLAALVVCVAAAKNISKAVVVERCGEFQISSLCDPYKALTDREVSRVLDSISVIEEALTNTYSACKNYGGVQIAAVVLDNQPTDWEKELGPRRKAKRLAKEIGEIRYPDNLNCGYAVIFSFEEPVVGVFSSSDLDQSPEICDHLPIMNKKLKISLRLKDAGRGDAIIHSLKELQQSVSDDFSAHKDVVKVCGDPAGPDVCDPVSILEEDSTERVEDAVTATQRALSDDSCRGNSDKGGFAVVVVVVPNLPDSKFPGIPRARAKKLAMDIASSRFRDNPECGVVTVFSINEAAAAVSLTSAIPGKTVELQSKMSAYLADFSLEEAIVTALDDVRTALSPVVLQQKQQKPVPAAKKESSNRVVKPPTHVKRHHYVAPPLASRMVHAQYSSYSGFNDIGYTSHEDPPITSTAILLLLLGLLLTVVSAAGITFYCHVVRRRR
ncbi:Hypp7055 [Branchiostoma lanceolatum]|uniref:Hypp7055 protein n=1 Tax=Branchiostoma lanceolatum TaxID=7740 RepID=A0A8J9YWZ6_BRALA|nr:Hypp7055 [Branchiostoma lanceolatum]